MSKLKVKTYLSAGAKVITRKGSEALVLSKNAKANITMRNETGALTPAGKIYEKLTGSALPEGGFLDQKLQRKGNTEYLKLRNGSLQATRYFNGDEYRFTRLGKRYYSTDISNFVIVICCWSFVCILHINTSCFKLFYWL